MKLNWKRLAALLLAVILMLSLTGMGEEGITDNDLILGGDSFDESVLPEGLELNEPQDNPGISILNSDLSEPMNDEIITPEQNPTDDPISNALVTKIRIGVKEHYTINTRSLRGKLTFASSKAAVASVSKKGVITGRKVGTAKITIKTSSGKNYKVTVTVAKAPSKVTLNKKTATLNFLDTLQLKAKLPGKTASNKLIWTSSNKKVASVNKNGEVTALSKGTATIAVKTFNGKKATCKITVAGYTGDLTFWFGLSFEQFNSVVDDRLKYIDYYASSGWTVYGNKYMEVAVDEHGIAGIALKKKSSKYTLTGIYPGMSISTAHAKALEIGWDCQDDAPVDLLKYAAMFLREGKEYFYTGTFYRYWFNWELRDYSDYYLFIYEEGVNPKPYVGYVTMFWGAYMHFVKQ